MAKAKPINQQAQRSPAFTGNIRDEIGRFKPGCSGNPAGKPRGSVSLTARMKAELDKVPPGQRMSWADVLAKLVVKRALEGDPRMIGLLLRHAGSEFRGVFKEATAENANLGTRKASKTGLPEGPADS